MEKLKIFILKAEFHAEDAEDAEGGKQQDMSGHAGDYSQGIPLGEFLRFYPDDFIISLKF